jgi:CMP-N-acetylneuraminic acid synthetase
MRNVCIIPARKGSKRLPGKNRIEFFGRPIIQNPIDAAVSSGLFERIEVSTDDEAMRNIVFPPAVINWRSPELCADDVPDIDVVRHYCDRHRDATYLCYLYATAALVTPAQLLRGLSLLRRSGVVSTYCCVGHSTADVGQFYWFDVAAMISNKLQTQIGLVLDDLECQDINTADDLWIAEQKLRATRNYITLKTREVSDQESGLK